MIMPQLNISIIGRNQAAESIFTLLKHNYFESASLNNDSQLAHAELIIETENLERHEKINNLKRIDGLGSQGATILSSTLQWTATEVASWLTHPERLVGFGAFADVGQSQLIEIAPGLQTEPQHLQLAKDQLKLMGKEIEMVEDEAGLVYPRILSLIINEAIFALAEGTASAEDIDNAMKKGTNYPDGPLEWAEKVGIDNVYAVLNGLYRQLGEERYRPASLLRKLVYAGWTGRASGKGLYYYEQQRLNHSSNYQNV
ncbi:3-hydroxyacyl-CoA dehydrogenase family protein [Halobacillus naozhouensis]|uniref:3-hydroxyacyl-CoA dehydrogenase family protein n=1 Tax=Halobacillus naozhouensis TaxID=554880 RepID=A0ABY8IYT0_9BACI|nr:3-hydroxyacyl-CoA dehydrogenase family protein [Halobacillus naozhouensis]WFT75360.1 3-hydroxyacyl-CoA dehydrogenase family protein [Halobacillus naozhouensis]